MYLGITTQCKWPLPLAFGSILGSSGNAQVLPKPNVVSCALPLLPRMAPMVSMKGPLKQHVEVPAALTILTP